MVVGAIAPNAHEGSRSEYLAQYVFASFGAAVAIPHQEDSGIDLHCTLTERVGQRAWPRSYFSVQVKSTTDAWDFKDSVQWLIEYPLPLFLCVVDKASTRLRVYHTCPRFYSWALPPLPDRLKLVPATGSKGKCTQWEGGTTFSLSAPILDATVLKLQNDNFHRQAWNILRFWAGFDLENLDRSGRVFTLSGYPVRTSPIRRKWMDGRSKGPTRCQTLGPRRNILSSLSSPVAIRFDDRS
jgi:hypothetical protein